MADCTSATESNVASAEDYNTSSLDSFSSEILFAILSCCEYFSLPRVSMVNRKWRCLVQDKLFDTVMFRQGWSRKKLAPGGKVELHPLLEQINPLGWDIGQIEPYVSHRTLGNALDLPVANELVTSPCTEELEVDFLIGFSCAVRRKKGVRIRDALKLFKMFWAQPVLQGMAEHFRANYADSVGGLDGISISRRDLLLDHDGWDGWEEPIATSACTVRIASSGYSS